MIEPFVEKWNHYLNSLVMTLSSDDIISNIKILEVILEFIVFILEIGNLQVKSELINAGLIRIVLRVLEDKNINLKIALFCLRILKNLVRDDVETSKTLMKFKFENQLMIILKKFRNN